MPQLGKLVANMASRFAGQQVPFDVVAACGYHAEVSAAEDAECQPLGSHSMTDVPADWSASGKPRSIEMTDLWPLFEEQLALHLPSVAANLRPGVSESQWAAFEAEIGQTLPDDVREAYLRHDGSDHGQRYNEIGLFSVEQWLSLSEVLKRWRWRRDNFDSADPYHYDEDEWGNLPLRPWTGPPPVWIPIAKWFGSPSLTYVDMLPGPLGVPGQLVSQSTSSMSTCIFADSLSGYLEYLLRGLTRREIVVILVPHTEQQQFQYADGRYFEPPGARSVFG